MFKFFKIHLKTKCTAIFRPFFFRGPLNITIFFLKYFSISLIDSELLLSSTKHNKIFFNLGSGEKLSLTKTFHLIKNKYPKSKSKIVFNKSILTGPKKRFTNCKNLKKIGWNQKIKLNEGINLI